MKAIANARDALYSESHDGDPTDFVPRYEIEISVTTEVPNGLSLSFLQSQLGDNSGVCAYNS